MGSIFKFKQFDVDQSACAMKINTDGVIIAAYVKHEKAQHILDIGTGTGVIALMLAQRFPNASIDAVEIDQDAFNTASRNFANSPFSNRIKAISGSFLEIKSSKKYDLIVSNPPFYTNSLHNPDDKKKLAKHTDYEFFIQMLMFAKDNLMPNGALSLIIPVDLAEYIIEKSIEFGYALADCLSIQSFDDSDIIRKIITLIITNQGCNTKSNNLIIYQERGIYSVAYKELLKPFFLAF